MEQTTQKLPLPIKTKIAAWIMIVSGILGILNIGAYGFYMTPGPGVTPLGTSWALSTAIGILSLTEKFPGKFLSFLSLILTLIYFIGAFFIAPIFLLRRKKWAWQFIIISLFISAILIFFQRGSFPRDEEVGIFYPIILFILLLLDRKNFWEITT